MSAKDQLANAMFKLRTNEKMGPTGSKLNLRKKTTNSSERNM